MATVIGSSRHDENSKYIGGKVGDQKQFAVDDFNGEVSMQYLKDFIGKRYWYVLRPKQAAHAIKLAEAMRIACNNANVGYDQDSDRYGVVNKGVNTNVPVGSDCSSNVRACVKYATGKDVGDFHTGNEVAVLEKSGYFDKAIPYKTGMTLYEGDVLVTQTKGHTGICVYGVQRVSSNKPAVARPTIRKGSTGEQALILQRDLNYVINAGLEEDGKFGKLSTEALREWQKLAGFTGKDIDGIYGNKSFTKMSNMLA